MILRFNGLEIKIEELEIEYSGKTYILKDYKGDLSITKFEDPDDVESLPLSIVPIERNRILID